MQIEKRAFFSHSLTPKVIRFLFEEFNGIKLSYEYRKSHDGLADRSLTFGEIDPNSFLQILEYIRKSSKNDNERLNFVDLGSGLGRACFTAAFSILPLSKIVGIELVPDLHEASLKILKNLNDLMNFDFQKPNKIDKHPKKKNDKNINILQEIIELLKKEQDTMSVQNLANSICKTIGHKIYKNSIKPYKSFANLLIQNAALFLLSDDRCSVSLNPLAKYNDNDPIPNHATSSETSIELESNHYQISPTLLDPSIKKHELSDIKKFDPLPAIELIQGDIFEFEWWETADIVYVASLLFSDKMMEKLTQLTLKMKKESWIISLKPLLLNHDLLVNNPNPLSYPHLMQEGFYKMSWQMAKVYFYQIK